MAPICGHRQVEHPSGVALVVSGLRLAQQHVGLHGDVVTLLRPLHRPVVPVEGADAVAEVAVEEADELGRAGGDLEQ
ncbi:hypothetical protein I4I84_06445 [Pseudonocardia sp. KRD-182]|uniref:hypothetical protein n=1 Tax=Pseudonocardia oceani TaxID=2792013 RepID=UPI001C49F6CB|nr:hypothetical protein [Pseudonocardia oceani]MBW0108375.1 hypothetical protein [Pseudonocardia oceani]